MTSLTTDSFFNGRIRVMQHKTGYRFSIDAVLLAHHARWINGVVKTVLDLGTGCGIIPLILIYRHPEVRAYGIEIQKGLADIAELNVRENGMEDRISIFHKDMKEITCNMIPEPIDLVISNPPYRKADSGRINPNQERAIARHEIKATISDVLQTARRILQISGKFMTIYPAERMPEMLRKMHMADIEPKYIRMIHSKADTGAKLILVQGIRGGRPGVKIGPPLIIYQENGDYTEEVSSFFCE